MNGRIYDPKLGRFLQADPIVQAPKNSQNLNRYSYVLNNPLSYTDPTGHSFFKKYWRVVVAAVAIYFTAGAATGWVAGWGAAWGTAATATTAASLTAAGGAVVGAITGAIGGAILTGTVKGAFYGALSGAALGAIGASGLNKYGKAVAGGAANGITSELQGGKFGHGFLSAGAGTLTGVKLGGPPSFGKFLGAAIAGGTISEATGGKFANGAISAGLAYVVAAAASQQRDQGRPLTENEGSAAREALGDDIKDYDSVRIFNRKWMFFQGKHTAMAPDGNIYWPAAGNCSDLTNCVITSSDGAQYPTLPTFIHEMGHVMQYQNGVNVILQALPHQLGRIFSFGSYNPYMSRSGFYSTPTPLRLNVEAQADWYMHNYCVNSGNC